MKSTFSSAFGLAESFESLFGRGLHLLESTCNGVVFMRNRVARAFRDEDKSPACDANFAELGMARIQF